jgi:hypothetical protein
MLICNRLNCTIALCSSHEDHFTMLHSKTITHAHRDVDGARQDRRSEEQSALLSPIVQAEEQVQQ